MQLAGIGLAEPDQVKDVLEFYVGAGDDAGVVRFQVVGPEEIDSALGKLASVHLVQLAAPGQPRLEVWLAPGRHWLPVQLRVTAPDGSALTQLVTAICRALAESAWPRARASRGRSACGQRSCVRRRLTLEVAR